MQALQPYKAYLPWLVVLLVARFVWQPLWETRQENWQQLAFNQNTLAKTQALLTLSAEMSEAQQHMGMLVKAAELKLTPAENLTRVKLDTQQQLEQMFNQHNLQISLSAWRDGVMQQDVQTLVLDLSFSGKLQDYLKLQQQMQQQVSLPSLLLLNQRLNIRGQNAQQLGDVTGDVSLRVAIRLKDAS
ncbi:hypothetical protein [Rheinheimera sp.]|uniref:hypothetical protein n=1 Tax=Rheinheimera sp. TaxID=1869214 RepID=UPI00307EF707